MKSHSIYLKAMDLYLNAPIGTLYIDHGPVLDVVEYLISLSDYMEISEDELEDAISIREQGIPLTAYFLVSSTFNSDISKKQLQLFYSEESIPRLDTYIRGELEAEIISELNQEEQLALGLSQMEINVPDSNLREIELLSGLCGIFAMLKQGYNKTDIDYVGDLLNRKYISLEEQFGANFAEFGFNKAYKAIYHTIN